MTASEIYIKYWNQNYGTNYGEGKAPHYAVAAMIEFAGLAFNAAREKYDPMLEDDERPKKFETFQDYLNSLQSK